MRTIVFMMALIVVTASAGCGLDFVCAGADADGNGAVSVQEYRDLMGTLGEEFEDLGTDAEVGEAILLLGCTPE